ncbi:MAG: heme lyase CcmF/NrfE family subunit [Deltaproteobacteria bacterium]|nr:heme lyase CcmF/NrfE family subunit [Deltaproteobacteria bacterium]MBW2361374.1 heme lyase CcmF/NrfE family subunit [Deltaproteobacteria bacterium]
MSELGALALRFALPVALLGLVAGVVAAVRELPRWTRVAERSVHAVALLVTLAIAVLMVAFAANDFQLAYVANNSARDMALPYRLAAVWGGQAGSLLLWLVILMGYSSACVVTQRHQNRRLMPWVTAVLHANAIFFLVLLVFVTDPFEKLPPSHVLSDGAGLNPLLQHPVMMIHPITLYLGLVGFVIPYAFGFAALLSGELDSTWFRTTRRWTLVPWLFLSIGILLGGRWAYEVLGWGGYWAWDPVENASFMPWLPATAYLHSVMIQEKRNMLKTWNLLLIGLTYTLCLFGTFLTRSGIVQSVHAFAQTPLFQLVFLGYVLLAGGLFLAALLVRRGELQGGSQLESMVSREASFLLNNWAFIVILAVVFVGTLFPVFSELFGERRIVWGPSFFNQLLGPLGIFLLLLTGIGPLIAWRKASRSLLRRQFTIPTLTGLVVLLATFVLARNGIGEWELTDVYGVITWGVAAFVAATIVQEYWRAIRARMRKGEENALQAFGTLLRKNQQRYGGYIVHFGMVLIFIGVAGSILEEERLENVKPGDEIEIGDKRIHYLTAEAIPEQHFGGARARLALYRGDQPLGVMTPEKRMYWLQEQPASIPSVHSTLREDLYVILTALEQDGSATLKIYRNPLVNWIWIGGVIFVLGTISVMWPHPRRRQRVLPQTPAK